MRVPTSTAISPRALAVLTAALVLGGVLAAPHPHNAEPEPFDSPPALSAAAVAHNDDPAVIGPARRDMREP